MNDCKQSGIRGTVLLVALAAAVLLGGCAQRKLEPAEADAALTRQTAKPAQPTTPEVANPAIPKSPVAADEAVGPPESARPATPPPVYPAAPGVAVGEPDPHHQVRRDDAAAAGKSSPSADCRTDSDCAIKDVGSCCGYSPQCVNKNTQTFPEQVRARCGQEGRMGICGFPAISGCQCVSGKCSGIASSGDNPQVQ
ncbi:MAG: hypothetical protein ABIW30_02040 [Arenimonas sp.]